jgi:hypothetical protein
VCDRRMGRVATRVSLRAVPTAPKCQRIFHAMTILSQGGGNR